MKQELEKDEFELKLMQWKEQYGVETRSKRYGTPYMSVPKDPVRRREMLMVLIDTLRAEPYVYESKDFGFSLKQKIVDACVFVDYEDTKILKKWRAHVEDDLKRALATVFKGDFTVLQRDAELDRQEFLSPEEENKLKNPLDKAKLGDFAVPTDVIDEDFLKELEGNNE